jgi:hypothetical protein
MGCFEKRGTLNIEFNQNMGQHKPEAKFMNVQFLWGSEHNLQSSQIWGYCMGLEGGMVFYQVFLLSALQCTVTEQETVRDCVS